MVQNEHVPNRTKKMVQNEHVPNCTPTAPKAPGMPLEGGVCRAPDERCFATLVLRDGVQDHLGE